MNAQNFRDSGTASKIVPTWHQIYMKEVHVDIQMTCREKKRDSGTAITKKNSVYMLGSMYTKNRDSGTAITIFLIAGTYFFSSKKEP